MNRERTLTLYILATGVISATVLAYLGIQIAHISSPSFNHWLPYAVAFVAIDWICSRQRVYFTESNKVTMGTIGQIAAVIVLPLPFAVWPAAIAKAAVETQLLVSDDASRGWRGAVVNSANTTLSVLVGGLLFHALQGPHYLWSHDGIQPLLAVPALLALGTGYHVVNSLVITGPVTLTSRERANAVLFQIFNEALIPEISLIFVSVVFAVLFRYSPVLSVLIVVPVLLSMRSFGAVARLRKETVEAVLKMAESIDIRDTGTGEHSKRLERYARDLAAALGLTPEHTNEVGLAARTHDLGKIEISDAILLKPGPLTTEERERMEQHPVIGAEMLASYLAFEKSVEFVKHHHERWDGNGYPDGLKGEEIPVGSRIISVVDAYDSMREDRPYRPGMSIEQAVDRLKAGMGSQFDPNVCAKWIQLLIEQGEYQPADLTPSLRIINAEAS